MRIAVMLRTLEEKQGIGVYSRNLMSAILNNDKHNDYIFIYVNRAQVGSFGAHENLIEVVFPAKSKLAWDHITVPRAAKKYKADGEIKGMLVQKMVPPGQVVIMGVTKYPGFGHLLMFGLGGIYVELFKNVTFRLAPVGRNNARRMIRSINGFEALNGFRGQPIADIEKLEQLIVGLSAMVTNHPQIKEMDINPLFVHEQGKGATVADIIITFDS